MVKDYTDYITRLCEMYPGIERESITECILKGLDTTQDLMRRDHDLRLEQLHCNFDQYRLILYKSKKTELEKKQRYFSNLYRITKYRDKKQINYDEKRLSSK